MDHPLLGGLPILGMGLLIGIGLCVKDDREPEPFRSEVFAQILELPEVVRFAREVCENSGGRARMIAYLEGQASPGVWDVYVGESHASHTVRWATFRLNSASGEIFVSRPDGDYVPRREWVGR